MLNYTEEYQEDLKDISKDVPSFDVLRKKRIFITGASGLICSAVVDSLMAADETGNYDIDVYAAGRDIKKLETRFEHWKSSSFLHLLKYDAMVPVILPCRMDYVIHGAGNANPKSYFEQPVETLLTNIYGVNHLLYALYQQGSGRFLYISSSEVYGKRSTPGAYQENEYYSVDVLNPRSCYPSSKRAAETLCASYLQEHKVDSVIVRPGHVYGPTVTDQDNRASSQFPKEVMAGEDITMKSNGLQKRSYCYVLDCVSAILTVLLKGQSGEAYNISNPHSIVSIREMAEAFANAASKKVRFEDPTNNEKASYNLMEDSVLSSEKLERLGWHGKYDMNMGAERTLHSLIGNVKKGS